jgi:diguanylate cyclase (GGDEF)-like protein
MSFSFPLPPARARRRLRRAAVALIAGALVLSAVAVGARGLGLRLPEGSRSAKWGIGIWSSAFVAASAVAIAAFVQQRRLLRMLVDIRHASRHADGRSGHLGAIARSIKSGLGADGVRLDLSVIGEGLCTTGRIAEVPVGLSTGTGAVVSGDGYDRIRLERGEHLVGVLEVWWRRTAMSTITQFVGGRADHDDVLTLVGAAVAAEIEIVGLEEALATETLDHDRARQLDSLTGLLNRASFLDHVALAVAAYEPTRGAAILLDRGSASVAAQRSSSMNGHPAGAQHASRTSSDAHRIAAVAVLDVNRFAEINATLGHLTGDAVLREVSARVVGALPIGSVVARIGGDELGFLIELTDDSPSPVTSTTAASPEPDVSAVNAVLAKLVAAIRELVVIDDLSVLVDAAIGVALAPIHGTNPAVLIRRAEAAMAIAKDRRTTAFEIWQLADEAQGTRTLALATDLRSAIDDGELEVHYQPKTDLLTGVVVGVEALVRWNHPLHGWIAPDELIPLAERTGLIGALTRSVLSAALRAGADWNRQGLSLGVAVNLSARGLLDPTIVDDVASTLRATGFSANQLTLEITETELTPDAPLTAGVLDGLRRLGVKLAIDDFGTGYSALSYLARLNVDELKIDKSFVTDLDTDTAKQAIVAAVVNVADRLGLQTVAEGVEDYAVLDRLASMGCTTAQGYLVSKPLPASSMAMWLWERRRSLPSVSSLDVAPTRRTTVVAGSPDTLAG